MGHLDQASFDRAVTGGCPACGAATLEIRSFLDRSIVVMLGEPNDKGRWVHDGEKFIDGTYRITCPACAHVVFEHADCPRCHDAGGLARALGEPTRLAIPGRCGACSELELLAIAFVPAAARYGGGEAPKPQPLADYGEAGYHIVAFACDACDLAVVAEGCPLCGASGPLRARP